MRWVIALSLVFLSASGFAKAQGNGQAELQAAYDKGEALRAKGDIAQAIKQYERAVALAPRVYGDEDPTTATLKNNLGLLHQQLGQYAQAEPLLLEALRVWRKQTKPDHAAIALSFNNLGDLYRVLGQYSKAESFVRQSLKIREEQLGKEHADVAQSLHSLALIHQMRSELALADPLLRRTLALREKHLGADHLEVAMVLNSQAVLFVQMGQYAQAEAAYRRCLAIREKQLGSQHPDVGFVLHNLGSLHATLGRYGDAEPLILRSIRIWEAKFGADHHAVGNGLNSLGEVQTLQAKYGEAEPTLLRSQKIWERKFGPTHPNLALNEYNLGIVRTATKNFASAENSLRRSLQIREAKFGKEHPNAAMTIHALALTLAAQEKWSDSARLLDRSRQIVRKHVAQTLPVLAEPEQLIFLQTRYEPEFHQALSLGLESAKTRNVAELSAAWLINGKAVAQQALAEATLQARDSQDPALAEILKELTSIRRQLAALSFRTEPDASRLAELAQLATKEQELAKRLRQAGGRFTRTNPWVELQEVWASMQPGTVLVEFARFRRFDFKTMRADQPGGTPCFAAWIIPADLQQPVRIVDLGDAEPIEERIRSIRQALQTAGSDVLRRGEQESERELKGKLAKLSELVLHPLLPILGDNTDWTISPDGDLWLVPWNALTLPDGRYAVEKLKINSVISGRDLLPGTTVTQSGRPLVLADPDYDLQPQAARAATEALTRGMSKVATRSLSRSVALPIVSRLPGTLREAREITPKLKEFAGADPIVRTDKNALEGVFKTAVRPRVLVLSTHGFFLDNNVRTVAAAGRSAPIVARPSDNPLLRCGLLLAGCNRREQLAAGDEDGVLTGLEIVSTDLRGTELVVLSACETGLGKVNQGEGVAGLRQAFQLAGAKTVVATLWQIPDKESTQVMSGFFGHLAQRTATADSLRDAQLEIIRARKQRNGAAHPFFWAGYVVTGQ